MQRRRFIGSAGAALGAATLAAPAMAQQNPQVRWRMSTAWPKSLDSIYGSVEELCARVGQLTDGRFEVRPYAGGELVPPLQSMEAVSQGTVECNHVLASFFFGRESAIGFDTGLPFGLNARQHNAWLHYGGGMEMLRKMYRKHNVVNFTCGNVGVQMGGFYRREIKSLADLKGLKMRIGGIGGMVLSKLGAVPQQIPTSDIYSSLEKGTIDAAEWIGPYDDEKLGLHKVAQFYYAPGWWEGSASITTHVNVKAWEGLPPAYQAAFEAACNEQTMKMLARYDNNNPEAMRRLIGGGAKVGYFPRDVMDAAFKTSEELYKELAEKNPEFAAILPSWTRYRQSQTSWFRIAEMALDNYTANALASR